MEGDQASLLMEARVSTVLIMEILRHSQVQITRNITRAGMANFIVGDGGAR